MEVRSKGKGRFTTWSYNREELVALELSVLALYKGEEKFLFVYDAESREQLDEAIRHQAADPRLSLNWFDASVLAQKLQAQDEGTVEGPTQPVRRVA